MKILPLAFFLIALTCTASADPLQPLQPNQPVHAVLGGGKSLPTSVGGTPALYRIEVPANVAARVRLRHQGLYVVLRVELAGTGQRVVISEDSNGENGEEMLSIPIRDVAVAYDLGVIPVPREVCGTFDLVLEHLPVDERTRMLGEAHRLYTEGRTLELSGDAKSANTTLDRLAQASALFECAGEPLTQAEALYRSSIVYGQLSRISDGMAQLDCVIPLFQQLGFRGAEGRAINRRGEFARRLGDVVSAERDLKAALPLVTEANDFEGMCDARNNLGLLYEQTGRWDDAIGLLEEALPLTNKISFDLASSLEVNLGLAYSDMGDYARALPPLERALALKRKMNVPRRTAQTLHAVALVQNAMGNSAKAKDMLAEVTTLLEPTGDPQALGLAYATRGRLHLQNHELDPAAESFAKALELLRKAKDRRAEARAMASMARVQIERGQSDDAIATLSQALAGAEETGDRTNASATLYDRALTYQKVGRIDDALADAQRAVDVVESMREAIVNPDLRTTYLGTVRDYFDLVIELLMSKHAKEPSGGFAAEAFRANERSRARTLLESLSRSQANVEKGVPPELLIRERNARRQLDAKENYRVQLLRGEGKAAEIAATDRTIVQLLSESRAVKAEIRAVSPDYAALEFPDPVALADVQSRLVDAETTLLEYHLGSDRSYVWIVSDRGVEVRVLPGESQISALVKSWHDALRRNPSTLEAAAAQKLRRQTEQAGLALARAVYEPVASAVRGKRLVIVPDGALHYVPFAALPDRQRQPLITNHEITYLQSATLLDTLRRAPRREGPLDRVAVFADPVFQRNDPRFGTGNAPATPAVERGDDSEERWATTMGDLRRLRFSRKEAEAILGTADRRQSLEALDFRATKQALLSADLRRYGIIHIATHGIANAEEPDLSGLVFSRYDKRGKKIDGFLRLRDVYNLDLHAELVVLSACRTALGKVVYGEGLISLTRGFMYGGAKRVMATVWSVDDRAAAHLMTGVYDAMLRRGATPARALREAQTAMSRDPRWNDPYYWAAFTLQGDWK